MRDFMASVKIYLVWEVLEYFYEYPFVCDVVSGGTQDAQNRTGVSLNRGLELLPISCGGLCTRHAYIPGRVARQDPASALTRRVRTQARRTWRTGGETSTASTRCTRACTARRRRPRAGARTAGQGGGLFSEYVLGLVKTRTAVSEYRLGQSEE